jgi:putative phosphoribosyl transferase
MNNSVAQTVDEQLVHVPAGAVTLDGNLTLPEESRAVVLFAHGSGSSRHSPRNRYVACLLNEEKLATLLVDLLTLDEEAIDLRTGQLRFDIELLAERLVHATDWLTQFPDTKDLRIGYFGASTGPLLRWWRRLYAPTWWVRSSRTAAVPIWPARPWCTFGLPRC